MLLSTEAYAFNNWYKLGYVDGEQVANKKCAQYQYQKALSLSKENKQLRIELAKLRNTLQNKQHEQKTHQTHQIAYAPKHDSSDYVH